MTILHRLTTMGRNYYLGRFNFSRIEELFTNGADPNILDNTGHSACWYAVRNSKPELINLCLAHGCTFESLIPEINVPYVCLTTRGETYTMLSNAILNKDLDMVRRLVDNGADIHLETQSNLAHGSAIVIAMFHKCYDIVKFLISRGARITDQPHGWTYPKVLFEGAVFTNDPELVQAFIDAGADLNIRVLVLGSSSYKWLPDLARESMRNPRTREFGPVTALWPDVARVILENRTRLARRHLLTAHVPAVAVRRNPNGSVADPNGGAGAAATRRRRGGRRLKSRKQRR
jgi:ankyrin repeat protein